MVTTSQENWSALASKLIAVIMSAKTLSESDIGFVRSLNPELGARSEESSKRLLKLINDMIAKSSNAQGNSSTPPLRSSRDVVTQWRSIEQVLDLLADKAESPPDAGNPSSSSTATPSRREGSAEPAVGRDVKDYMRLANDIPKPQRNFGTKVDNSLRPFKPLLTSKPFDTLMNLEAALKLQPPDATHTAEWYDHPYRLEITHAKFPTQALHSDPEQGVPFPDWDKTPLTLVDTPDALYKMVEKLKRASVVAVDVEHHDYRSYLGLVCLLQISALGEDYVVDALALRSELQVLNKVFANPAIIKVLHGARMDVMWLQRDLGIYIVNLFDTYFAARELMFPKLSLAYLLKRFADFDAQKEFQLADWRYRPLPQELIDYARADTHFLLYVFDQIQRLLIENKQLTTVVEESRKVAQYRYEFPGWNESEPAWYAFALKYRLTGHLQRAICIRLLAWRDSVARQYDESTRYVMAPQFLANLCVMKPANPREVISAAHHVSPIVKKYAGQIAQVVQGACHDADSIDTNIPDYLKNRRSRFEKAAEASNNNVSAVNAEGSSAGEMKREVSAFLGVSQPKPVVSERPSVYLGAFNLDDLQEMHQTVKKEEEALVDEAIDDEIMEDVENASSSAESGDGSEQSSEASEASEQSGDENDDDERSEAELPRKIRKRLNVVDPENIEMTTKVAPLVRTGKVHADEPAFDFAGAEKVMSSGPVDDSRSFRQFNGKRGPKGAHKNNAKFKTARSIRR